MKKRKISCMLLLLLCVLVSHMFSFSVYALKDNKYIIDKRKDKYEYYSITSKWHLIYETIEENSNVIILYDGNRPPTDVGILYDAGLPNYLETQLVPDSINGTPVIGIEGSSVADGFDLNPQNEYMECIDNVIFSEDGKKLMSYPQNNAREVYSIPEGTEVIGCLAIAYSNNISKVIIPESTNKIEYAAFVGCDKLSEVSFLPSNTDMYIEKEAFLASYNLKEIILPSFNVSIDRSAFDEVENIPQMHTYEQPVLKTKKTTIKWNKIPHATCYEIYQKLSNGEYKLLKTTKGTSCRFGSLKSGKDYTFAIKPIAIIPAANYKKGDEKYYPKTFTIEGTMSEDVVVRG